MAPWRTPALSGGCGHSLCGQGSLCGCSHVWGSLCGGGCGCSSARGVLVGAADAGSAGDAADVDGGPAASGPAPLGGQGPASVANSAGVAFL